MGNGGGSEVQPFAVKAEPDFLLNMVTYFTNKTGDSASENTACIPLITKSKSPIDVLCGPVALIKLENLAHHSRKTRFFGKCDPGQAARPSSNTTASNNLVVGNKLSKAECISLYLPTMIAAL